MSNHSDGRRNLCWFGPLGQNGFRISQILALALVTIALCHPPGKVERFVLLKFKISMGNANYLCVRQSAQKSKQSVIWKSFHCWFYQTKMFPQTTELANADWKQKLKKKLIL